jgi:radical SAM superfamily enzyme YgiQ (UPF0313 family)
MRIHLISPTHYLRDGSLHKTTRYWTSAITLPYLKALTPSRHHVDFTDELMSDLAAGRSRGIYRAERWHDLRGLPAIDWWSLPLLKPDAFHSSWLYRKYFFWPVFFSRGCPHPCEYCAVQTYYKRSYRTRPVDDVIEDIRQLGRLGARRLLLLDDNPVARPEEAKEFFRRLIPLNVAMLVANANVHGYLRRNPVAWGTIS